MWARTPSCGVAKLAPGSRLPVAPRPQKLFCFGERPPPADARPDALAAGLFVVVADNVLDRAVELGLRVALLDVVDHLLLRRLCRAHDRDGIGRGLRLEHRFLVSRRQTPLNAVHRAAVDLARHLLGELWAPRYRAHRGIGRLRRGSRGGLGHHRRDQGRDGIERGPAERGSQHHTRNLHKNLQDVNRNVNVNRVECSRASTLLYHIKAVPSSPSLPSIFADKQAPRRLCSGELL